MSINVPSDKAKAVIDALEREMMDKIATRSDLEHAREILSRDIARIEERVTSSMKTGIAELETKLTLRLGVLMAAMFTAATALIAAIQYFQ